MPEYTVCEDCSCSNGQIYELIDCSECSHGYYRENGSRYKCPECNENGKVRGPGSPCRRCKGSGKRERVVSGSEKCEIEGKHDLKPTGKHRKVWVADIEAKYDKDSWTCETRELSSGKYEYVAIVRCTRCDLEY